MDGARMHAQLVSSHVRKDEKKGATDNGPEKDERINVDEPLWDQESYIGRWKHFAFITDCRTIFYNEERLCEAKKLCEDYKAGKEPTGTTKKDVIWAKKLRDSAFHPDNGQLTNVIGRMSFQLPGCLFLTAGMLAYYKYARRIYYNFNYTPSSGQVRKERISAVRTARGIVGWQVINQGFNAIVNYSNRNARDEDQTDENGIATAFLVATAAGSVAALTFRKMMSYRGDLMKRWTPFVAVAAANMVNLPIMRQNEIKHGIEVGPKESEKSIMKSKLAALKGISECVVTRIVMAAPGMMLVPVIVNILKPYCFYQMRPRLEVPLQTALCGLFLSFMIPTALAIYPQRNSMHVWMMKLCDEEYDKYQELTGGTPNRVYYNKGL
ncbi:sideroflexin-2-like [Diprion similis]|uniref:sideroflexin-2-like n=1 Tax=Diprion similis TaxID=362088 RepID=UPI001EF8B816|nr:sideroflexin-2-like [Diprion similis]